MQCRLCLIKSGAYLHTIGAFDKNLFILENRFYLKDLLKKQSSLIKRPQKGR